MSKYVNEQSNSNLVTEIVQQRSNKFQNLVFKLKTKNCHSDLSSLTKDLFDQFVDQTINDLQKTLLSNINHLQERVDLIRPKSSHPFYSDQMIIYQQLFEQTILLVQQIEQILGQISFQLNILTEQLSNEISMNKGINIDQLLSQHSIQINQFIQQNWIKDFNTIEATLNALS